MKLYLFAGRANPALAGKTAAALGMSLGRCELEDFPDGEQQVRLLEDVQGAGVCLLQPTAPPVAGNLLELLLLADACRRGGADRLTAVIPYFGYARQDRRTREGEAVGGQLAAELLETRFDRLLTVDLHNPAIEGFCRIPMQHLSAIPLLAQALRSSLSEKAVVVAPDLGAAKLAQRYADLLGLPSACIHKERKSGREVQVRRIIGEVRGREPVVVDDMISTGGTLVAAIETLLDRGCLPRVTVAASHALLVGDAGKKLARLPVQRLVATDSVPPPAVPDLPLEIVGLGPVLAAAVRRLHEVQV